MNAFDLKRIERDATIWNRAGIVDIPEKDLAALLAAVREARRERDEARELLKYVEHTSTCASHRQHAGGGWDLSGTVNFDTFPLPCDCGLTDLIDRIEKVPL